MGLQSALSTALTGLTAAETTIDVVGNNLANSNTVGFKASTASFSTQFLQTLGSGSGPTPTSGGTNPRQVGMGTMVADITPDFNQGTLEISSSPTDLAIQGDGFFIVEGSLGEQLYTRNGIFKFNSQNELVTITGNRLLGFGSDDDFQIQRTSLEPVTIPLGAAAVAQPTGNVFLEGSLRPEGDLAVTAQQIQTGIFGNARFEAPATQATVSQASAPSVTAALTRADEGLPGPAMPAGDYAYKFVWASGAYAPGNILSESAPSDSVTVMGVSGAGPVELTNIPLVAPSAAYDYVRIYRAQTDGARPTEFEYINEIGVPAGPATYTDTTAPNPAAPLLDETLLSGNYNYYVTYADQTGGYGMGIETRPSPISGSLNIVNGRAVLTGLPVTADPTWAARRVYRNLSTDDSTFYYVGEISNASDPAVTISDNLSDATLLANNEVLDMDGPKAIVGTLLTDLLSRNGATYEHVFQEGTLEFTGRKAERSLATKEFTVDSTTTVQDLIDFMDEALGIQATGDDPINPIPVSTEGGSSIAYPGGRVEGGRIILTGNNGVDNAIDIPLSGMLLRTATGVANIDMPWGVAQEAVGESAVADFLVYDSLGIPIRMRLTAVMESRDSTSTTYRWFADSPDNDPTSGAEIAVGTGLVTFDGEGNLITVSESTISVERRNVSSASPLEFEMDFSSISGLAADASSLAVSRQDGSGPGVLTSFIAGQDGIVKGVFSNGVTRDLAQIRLARFANAAGLEQRGENLYAEGVNSGLPVQADPGQQGVGALISGALELSNTDIGSNLIDLILASTMYRGNTRVITTAQQMVDELLALRR